MIKYACIILTVIMPLGCCGGGLLKKPIMIEGVVDEKVRMDGADNPAARHIIKEDLGNRRIEIPELLVKEVTESTNIDYDFCIKADVSTKKGTVECNIYTDDVKTIAKLEKGKTKIEVRGLFGRFFSLPDSHYTRIEIIKSCVKILP